MHKNIASKIFMTQESLKHRNWSKAKWHIKRKCTINLNRELFLLIINYSFKFISLLVKKKYYIIYRVLKITFVSNDIFSVYFLQNNFNIKIINDQIIMLGIAYGANDNEYYTKRISNAFFFIWNFHGWQFIKCVSKIDYVTTP